LKVSLFITCFNDALFPQTGQAVVRLLERLGCEVEFRAAQTCCGQMHNNSGYQPEAVDLVRRFVEVFQDAEIIVAPSTSCTAMIRHQYPRLAHFARDGALERDVAKITPKVFELSEFLTDVLELEDVGAYFPHRVTYHASCNSLRALKLGDRALRLLNAVKGLDLVELQRPEECCGFGGTFAVKNAETSTAMLADKMRHVVETGAEVCTAGDNSCLMHIGGGLSRLRTGVRTLHLAEILASTEAGMSS
jgi:L-lactate dehydrogenase complex protein LldE